jgi:hypothetical protein
MRKKTVPLIAILIMFSHTVALMGAGIVMEDESSEQEHFQIAWVYGFGSPVEFTVKASRGKISMAGSVEFILEARFPVGWKVSFPEIDESVGGLLVRDVRDTPAELDPRGNMVMTREYLLEPLSPGLYIVPPVELVVGETYGEYAFTLTSDVIPIIVTSLLPEGPAEPQLLDMTILADPVSRLTLFAGIIAALAVCAVGLIFLRKRPTRADGAGERTYSELALGELDSLLSEGLIERGAYRQYYSRLCAFLRDYIARRFMVQANEQTTEELLSSIVEQERFGEYRDMLVDFLKACDLAKFSQSAPTLQIVRRSTEQLREFIKTTGTITNLDSVEPEKV